MTMLLLWLMLAAQQKQAASPQATVMVCTKPEERRPSLYPVGFDGKCPKDSKEVLGADKKPMYCVSTYHPKPGQCKQQPVK